MHECWDDKRVQFYIETWGPPTNPKKVYGLQRMEIPVKLLQGDTALDVGCGIGHLYCALKGKVTTYVGIDASLYMLAKAREFFPEGDFRQGDVYDLSGLPLFDTVYSISLLIHLDTAEEPVRQLWSRAKKRLVILIPLGRREQIKRPEPGLIYHQFPFKMLDTLVDSLPDVKQYEKTHWAKNHYFVMLDRRSD